MNITIQKEVFPLIEKSIAIEFVDTDFWHQTVIAKIGSIIVHNDDTNRLVIYFETPFYLEGNEHTKIIKRGDLYPKKGTINIESYCEDEDDIWVAEECCYTIFE